MSKLFGVPRGLIALVLIAGVLVVLPSSTLPAEASAKLTIKVSPSKPIRGEQFTVAGIVPTEVARPVMLQRKSGSKWKTVTTTTTASAGNYAFNTATGGSSVTVRVVAPAVTIGGAVYRQVISSSKKVRTVGQKATVSIPGSAFVNQAVTVKLKFSPARTGRPVQVQVKQGSRWVEIAAGVETNNGKVSIQLTAAAAGKFTYRAMATAANGAPAKATKQVKVTIKPDKVKVNPDTRPVTPAEAAKITSYSPASGTLVMSKPPTSAKSITKGDFLTVPPIAAAASGALLKVAGVARSGSTMTVKTVGANLPQVVQNVPDEAAGVGLGLLSSRFTPTDGVSVTSVPVRSSRLIRASGLSPASVGELNLKMAKKWSAGGASVQLDGDLSIAPTIDMSVDMDWFTLKSYKLGAGIQAANNLTATASYAGSASHRFPLGDLTQIYAGFIGAVPVWVQADFVLFAQLDAEGKITVTASVTQNGRSTAGVTSSGNFNLNPQLYTSTAASQSELAKAEAEGSLNVLLGAETDLMLYSAAGPYARIGATAGVTLNGNLTDGFTCKLSYGPLVEIGLKTSDALNKLTGKSFDKSTQIVKPTTTNSLCPAGTPTPPRPPTTDPLAMTTTSLPDAIVGQTYTATLTATGGTSPYTWTWTGLPAGLDLDANSGVIGGTPSLAGNYTPTVTVTDHAGTTKTKQLPMDITSGSGQPRASQIAASEYHSCALTSGGAVECWGANSDGQLGDGTTAYGSPPVQVVGLTSGVAAITVGYEYSCALTSAGAVKCWGYNGEGLGDGITASSTTPVQVVGLTSGVTAITANDNHTCALTSAGAVKCWGFNYDGQLGDGTHTSSNTPIQVAGLTSGVTAIAAGRKHTCALTSVGTVRCWGLNNVGQLGDGTYTDSATPVQVAGLTSDITAITAGGEHTCAVTSASAAKCWGVNNYGQLGDGTTTNSATPVQVAGLTSGVTAITGGGVHTCAVTSAGAAKCWGNNIYGELGDGTTTNSATPVQVAGLTSGITAITGGGVHTCAVTSAGAAKCWGSNGSGQLGNDTYTDSHIPVDVIGFG